MWIVYMLLCEDGSYYIGVTNNLEKRFKEHVDGKGGKYTRSHKPTKIVYQEELDNKSVALKREFELKKLTKSQKDLLISINRVLRLSRRLISLRGGLRG